MTTFLALQRVSVAIVESAAASTDRTWCDGVTLTRGPGCTWILFIKYVF